MRKRPSQLAEIGDALDRRVTAFPDKSASGKQRRNLRSALNYFLAADEIAPRSLNHISLESAEEIIERRRLNEEKPGSATAINKRADFRRLVKHSLAIDALISTLRGRMQQLQVVVPETPTPAKLDVPSNPKAAIALEPLETSTGIQTTLLKPNYLGDVQTALRFHVGRLPAGKVGELQIRSLHWGITHLFGSRLGGFTAIPFASFDHVAFKKVPPSMQPGRWHRDAAAALDRALLFFDKTYPGLIKDVDKIEVPEAVRRMIDDVGPLPQVLSQPTNIATQARQQLAGADMSASD